MLFKTILLIAAICSSVRADHEKVQEAEKHCQEKYHVTDEIFEKHEKESGTYEEFDITLKDETIEDHRCYIECLMSEMGMVNEGVVDLDAMIALAEEEFKRRKVEVDAATLKSEVVACTGNAGEGQCMVSYHSARCLVDMSKKHLH